MKGRPGNLLVSLLVSSAIAVITAVAVSRAVGWALIQLRFTQQKARQYITQGAAFNLLVRDYRSASMRKTDWYRTDRGWVCKTPYQWVSWFVRNNILYRRYGQFDTSSGRWNRYRTECIVGGIATIRIAPTFAEGILDSVSIAFDTKKEEGGHVYTRTTTLY